MPQRPNNAPKKTNSKNAWALNTIGMLKGDEWTSDNLALARHQEKAKRRAKLQKDSRKKNRRDHG